MLISIVIPTYNRKESINDLIRCIKSQELTSEIILKIVVVVDGNVDGTYELLNEYFNDLEFVIGTGNWWFTKSLNEGIKKSLKFNPDFILTLNDDLTIQTNYILSLIKVVKDLQQNAIIGSLSITNTTPRRVFFSGIKSVNFYTYSSKCYLPFMKIIEDNKIIGLLPSIWVPTRGMLIPFQIVKELHGFDEKFIQYGSDTDFCYRAAKIGVKSYISYDSIVFSDWEKTGSGSPYIQQSLGTYLWNIFFNKYSARFIGNNIRIIWRHFNKALMPLLLIKVLIAKITAYMKNQRIGEKINLF